MIQIKPANNTAVIEKPIFPTEPTPNDAATTTNTTPFNTTPSATPWYKKIPTWAYVTVGIVAVGGFAVYKKWIKLPK